MNEKIILIKQKSRYYILPGGTPLPFLVSTLRLNLMSSKSFTYSVLLLIFVIDIPEIKKNALYFIL